MIQNSKAKESREFQPETEQQVKLCKWNRALNNNCSENFK